MIVSVDPGVHVCGVATWEGKDLVCAELMRTEDLATRYAANVEMLVVENPQVYVRQRSKGNPNDLIDLAFAAGRIVGGIDPIHYLRVKPAEWKGQVPKDVMVERIKKRLGLAERANVYLPKQKSLAHNVWDAVGIGLWHLGRLG